MSSTKDNYGILLCSTLPKIIACNKENEEMTHASYIQQAVVAVVHESIQ